jgi:quercetin dioxygenase-like cupin family protein
MPTIFAPSDLARNHRQGISHTTLADRALLGTDALQVEHLRVDPGARSQTARASGGERFLYVIRGAGRAQVGAESFPLEPESILWLEPGDTVTLEAGAEALEVLQCRAPAET